MTVHLHLREGNSLKPTKCRTLVAKVCRETYSKKNIIKWSRKTATGVIKLPKLKGNAETERENIPGVKQTERKKRNLKRKVVQAM